MFCKLSIQNLKFLIYTAGCLFFSADPPCIPYLGYNLTDLNFIEDGTSDCNEDGLINFSKMRMVS